MQDWGETKSLLMIKDIVAYSFAPTLAEPFHTSYQKQRLLHGNRFGELLKNSGY